jgi:uncharacterized protein (DUF1501 family)
MNTRRAFLQQLALAAPGLGLASSSTTGRPHTLVCVFLRGGADTLNLVVPYAEDAYYRARPTLALPAPGKKGGVLKLDDHFGLHPSAAPLQAAFAEGRLAMLTSVGLDNTSGSHFECQDQMEHGDAAEGTPAGGGWLGRYLRAIGTAEDATLSAVAIGKSLPESLRGAPSVSILERMSDLAIRTPTGKPEAAMAALRAMYGASTSLLQQRGVQTLDLFQKVSQLQQAPAAPAHGADYGSSSFGSGLREIARLLKAEVGLRVACVDLNGWDTHIAQGSAIGGFADLVGTLASGLHAFDTDLKDYRSDYTVMVITEFGRRIHENASLGTDHGRGFTAMLLGSAVRGGRIVSPWPLLNEDESNPAGPGGLGVRYDYRSLLGEVLTRTMGLKDTSSVFPQFKREPLGMMRG